MVEETNRYYDQTVAALGGLDNLATTSCSQDWMPVDLPCMKAFLAILILMGVDPRNSYELYWTTIEYIALADAFHSLPQVPVGSGVQEARPAAKRGRSH